MLGVNFYRLFYDILAYLAAVRSLIDEILYKLRLRRHLDVRRDLPADLCGQVAIVTGGTRGLGLTVVRSLISKGCFVFVASSQTQEKFAQILEKIYDGLPKVDEQTGVARGVAQLYTLDLSSMESVSQFIKTFKSRKMNLNYLICNAGIMFVPRQLTIDGFESHFAVNYLGHCLIILELLPELKAAADASGTKSRIISAASSTHIITRIRFEDLRAEANYSSAQAYAQSKLAQICFSTKLARTIEQSMGWNNVQCFSLHPGVILSDLYEHVKLVQYFPFLVPLIKLVTRSMVEGAETTLYASLSPELNNVNGLYLEDCAIKKPSARALDNEQQDKLWDITYDLLKPWLTKGFTQQHLH